MQPTPFNPFDTDVPLANSFPVSCGLLLVGLLHIHFQLRLSVKVFLFRIDMAHAAHKQQQHVRAIAQDVPDIVCILYNATKNYVHFWPVPCKRQRRLCIQIK